MNYKQKQLANDGGEGKESSVYNVPAKIRTVTFSPIATNTNIMAN